MEQNEFINGVCFILRGGRVMQYKETPNSNPLLQSVPTRTVFYPDAPSEYLHIEFRAMGVLFWRVQNGVEMQSKLFRYSQITKVPTIKQ